MKPIVNLLLCAFLLSSKVHAGDIVIIGNSNVPQIDLLTVQKIYTGRVIAVSDVHIIPIAVKTGTPTRNRFLQDFMNQDEEKYTGYWTVRRYVGKGTPPNELDSTEAVINFVQSTPGAVGYIDEAELKTGLNVISKK